MDRASQSPGACHGFTLVGTDGPIGFVETPLFPPDCTDPDFLLVRLRSSGTRRLVPTGHIETIDPSAQIVHVDQTRADVLAFPDLGPQGEP
jgi:hypothetical protein